MLPSFIIEQIRQREEEELEQQPRVELEIPLPHEKLSDSVPPEADRGVIVIDLLAD